MKNSFLILAISLLLLVSCHTEKEVQYKPRYAFSIKGDKTYLNDMEILLKGLRLSNALISCRATEEMKESQLKAAYEHLDSGEGYMLASTWLQCIPPEGPNHRPGGYGSSKDPGIRWWLEKIREKYGAYMPEKNK